MNRPLRCIVVLLAVTALAPAVATAGEHRIGFGYHYWETLDHIGIDDVRKIDESGSAPVVSYQYLASALVRFEIDLEYFADGFGGASGKAYAPQVYLLLGRFLYAGVGVGITQSGGFPGGDDWSDPWYAVRGGIEILLLPRIHLDINANYRANAFDALEDARTDAMTLGASLRVALN